MLLGVNASDLAGSCSYFGEAFTDLVTSGSRRTRSRCITVIVRYERDEARCVRLAPRPEWSHKTLNWCAQGQLHHTNAFFECLNRVLVSSILVHRHIVYHVLSFAKLSVGSKVNSKEV